MAREEGAKKKILRYLQEHVGEQVPRKVLDDLVNHTGGWERSARALRDDGYELIVTQGKNCTYCLTSVVPVNKPKGNRTINDKLRAMVLLRDNSTCQMCGKSVAEDHIKVHVDHIVPYEWGGETVIDNLQCVCSICNDGKKNWEKSEDPVLMKEINKASSTKERLKKYFEYYPNKEIGVDKLAVVAKTREWTRQLRYVRSEYNMDIEYLPPNKMKDRLEAYIYHKPSRDKR